MVSGFPKAALMVIMREISIINLINPVGGERDVKNNDK
jgi:hypothetical protein